MKIGEKVRCKRCGKEFERYTIRHEYCSPGCRKSYTRYNRLCRTCGKPCTGKQCELCFFGKKRRRPNEK